SIWSASLKFMRLEAAAPGALGGLRSVSEMRGFSAVYAAGLGAFWKDADMMRDAASNWVIGLSPSISSMVRNMDVVLYMLLSTVCRLTYDEITKPGDRWESTWSAPFWASSSRTKIAVLVQKRDLETPSTN